MKKVEETIVIRNEKMIYAVRLKSKTEGEDERKGIRRLSPGEKIGEQ